MAYNNKQIGEKPNRDYIFGVRRAPPPAACDLFMIHALTLREISLANDWSITASFKEKALDFYATKLDSFRHAGQRRCIE